MRVQVTRPRDQAAATARRLRELGHEAVLAPALEIAPSREPAPPRRYDAVLVTSANAAPALAAERARFGQTPVLAVGGRSAAAALASGFDTVQQAAGDGIALVNLVRQACPPGARLLHAAGRDRKAEPARSLTAAGYAVTVWECYQALPATALPHRALEVLRNGQIDALLHYSRRSAEHFARLARQAGLGEALPGSLHLCLSPDVAHGLEDLAGLKLRVAPKPDEASLLGLLSDSASAPGSRPPQSRC